MLQEAKTIYYTLAGMILLVFFSCNTDTYYTGDTPNIKASLDTLTFDTVFTARGSATKLLKIYNHESDAIEIDVALEKGSSSMFRLNVDGLAGNAHKNVRIAGKDSIYVFVDVTVDPDDPVSISPFVIEEQLRITKGKSASNVTLVAWGQNANYIPGVKKKGIVSLLSCDLNTAIWDDPKPYVVYGVLVIDSCTLKVNAGTQIYIHGGFINRGDTVKYNDGIFFVGKDGKLILDGTIDAPVTIQGDRLEDNYKNRAGQWVGINILKESRGNIFRNTAIKNCQVAVFVDSMAQLSLDKCQIFNTSAAGLIGYHAQVDITNSLFYRNGRSGCQFVYGGDYSIKNSTFSNYIGARYSSIFANNSYCFNPKDCESSTFYNPLRLRMENTIAVGSDKNEVIIVNDTENEDPSFYDVGLTHMYMTLDTTEKTSTALWSLAKESIIADRKDTVFVNRFKQDFRLDTVSIVIDKGLQNGVTDDIIGNIRDEMPDIGCYEFVKE